MKPFLRIALVATLFSPCFLRGALPTDPASGDPGALAAKGNAAWRAGDRGGAVLMWERSLILERSQPAAIAGLEVAAEAGAKHPVSGVTEAYASALPESAWTWLAAAAFWTVVVALALPYVSSAPARPGRHALAGVALAVLILALPGIHGARRHRARAVVIAPETPLLRTPTRTGETVRTVEAGDRVRLSERKGDYRRVITADEETGWMRDDALVPIIPGE